MSTNWRNVLLLNVILDQNDQPHRLNLITESRACCFWRQELSDPELGFHKWSYPD